MIITDKCKLDAWDDRSIRRCFYAMNPAEREMIWRDGEFHRCGEKYYIAMSGQETHLEVVGCLIVSKTNLEDLGDIEMLTIFVHPEHRRKHVAQALIECAKRKAETDWLMAKVREINHTSMKLFLDCGFFPIETNKYNHICVDDQFIMACENWR